MRRRVCGLWWLAFLAACSQAPQPDASEAPEPSGAAQARGAAFDRHLDAIGHAVAAVPRFVSERARSCAADGTPDLLQGYLDALRARSADDALRAVARLHDVATCYDDQSFRALAGAFARTALAHEPERPEEREDLAVALAPVALLWIDDPRLPPGLLRIGYGDWFRRHAGRIARALHAADSPVPKPGLFAEWDDSFVQLPPDDAARLLESLGRGGFVLSRCRVQDLVAVEDGDALQLVCPKSCPAFEALLADLTPEERAEIRAGFPEYVRICDDLNRARKDLARVRPGVLACVRDYVEQTDSGVACVADRLAAARGPDALFERVRDLGRSPSIEVLRSRRRCQLSSMTPEERERYEELTDRRRKIVDHIGRHKDEIGRIDEEIRRVRRDIALAGPAPQPSGPAGIPQVPWNWGQHQQELQDLQRERQQHEDAIDELVDDLQDSSEEWRELDERYRSSTTRNCPPGVEGCGDACGLGSALSDPLVECMFQEDQALPGDDPIRQPDPRDPFDPDDPALQALRACIDAVVRESRRPGIADCPSVPDCPDPHVLGLGLRAEDDGPRRDCSCARALRPTDARNERLCRWVAMPTPGDPGRFTCPALGEDRAGDTQGAQGGVGGPDPEVFFEVKLGADLLE